MINKNLLANYLGQGWAALMGFIFVPSYIRYLGIEGYGLIGVFAVMQVWFGLLDMGMGVTLNRELARFTAGINSSQFVRNLLRSMELIAVGVGIFIGILIYHISDWMAHNWLSTSNLSYQVVSSSISIMGLVVALRIIEGLYRSIIIGLQRQVLYNILTSLTATFRWAGALVVLAFVQDSLEAFFLWQLISSFVTLVILAISAYLILPIAPRKGRFSHSTLCKIKKFAYGCFGFSLVNILFLQVDKLLLMRLLDLGDYGHYMLATATVGALNVLTGPVVQAFYPRMSELHAKNCPIEFSNIYHRAAQIVSVFFGTAAVVLIFNAEFILRLWTQDVKLATNVAPLLTLLGIGYLINGLMWVPLQAQLATGWTGMMIRIHLIMLVFYMPITWMIVPEFGAIGAAWVWLLLNLAYFLFMIQLMHRKILINDKWRWYSEDVALPIVASLGMVVFLTRVLNLENVSPVIDFTKLTLLSFLAVAVSAFAAKQIRTSILVMLKKRYQLFGWF